MHLLSPCHHASLDVQLQSVLISGSDTLEQPSATAPVEHWSAAEAPDPRPGGEQAGHDPQRDREAAGAAEAHPPVEQPHPTSQGHRVRSDVLL